MVKIFKCFLIFYVPIFYNSSIITNCNLSFVLLDHIIIKNELNDSILKSVEQNNQKENIISKSWILTIIGGIVAMIAGFIAFINNVLSIRTYINNIIKKRKTYDYAELKGQGVDKSKLDRLFEINSDFNKITTLIELISIVYSVKACRYYKIENKFELEIDLLLSHKMTITYFNRIIGVLYNKLGIQEGFKHIVTSGKFEEANNYFIQYLSDHAPKNVERTYNFILDENNLNKIEYGSKVLIAEVFLDNEDTLLNIIKKLKEDINAEIVGILSLFKTEDFNFSRIGEYLDEIKLYCLFTFKQIR